MKKNLNKKKQSVGKITLKDRPYIIGENYLIRTVTMIYTGKLIKVFDKELVITNASWIPETDRWAKTCEKGTFNEVEPYPINTEVILGRDAILDSIKVEWKLPRKQK